MLYVEPIFRSALDYASGTATRNGAAFDARGVDIVAAQVKFAAIADGATCSIKMQQCDASGFGSGVEDIAGSSQTIAGTFDNGLAVSVVAKPTKAYVRVVVTKDGSNAVAESAIYVGLGLRQTASGNNSGVSGLQVEINPGVAGTA